MATPTLLRAGAGNPPGHTVMKIIVAVKQVPVRDSVIRIDSAGKWIEEQDLSFEINEPDAYALEEALLLKEKHGGEVVVLCAGPERAGQTIREALAKGADRAIHIQCDDLVSLDTLALARRLAAAAQAENADLILTGLQSDDLGLGQTGVVMAEMLGIPHATIVMQVEIDGRFRPRQARTGRRVVSVGADAHARAADHPIRHQPAALRHPDGDQEGEDQGGPPHRAGADSGAAPPTVALQRIYLPHRKKETQILTGTPAEAAAKLADILKFEVRVI